MASPHATHEEIAAARRALFPADEPWEAKAGVSDLTGSITSSIAASARTSRARTVT